MSQTSIARPEFPRPDFERKEWVNLNGEWEFTFDDNEVGESEAWFLDKSLEKRIVVPFCFQSKASGIDDQGLHEVMWYKRTFEVSENLKGKRIQLHFGAVDYYAKVWMNGVFVGEHKGGYTPFHFDITNSLNEKVNTITVKVEDRYDTVQPRGKQYWKQKPDRCWYTATSGIWQTVWLEAVGNISIERIKITPDIDRKCILTELFLDKVPQNAVMEYKISFKGELIKWIRFDVNHRITKFTVNLKEPDDIDEIHYWAPWSPNLYDIELTLLVDDAAVDYVKSYFGMRKIAVKGDMILLNNRPFYFKLILDQGYWPESLLTPPSDEAIKYDVEMTKKMGFNGARKHQKIEDPRYYYWADKLGLIVWGEMPSAYNFNDEEIANITEEWKAFIKRDYNHPCIVAWVPLNESWGVRNILVDKNQQDFGTALYYLTKSMDGTRLSSTNDGWEQVHADFCAIHDYISWGDEFKKKYEDRDTMLKGNEFGRLPYAEGTSYQGQPLVITEYGGIAFVNDNRENWGYGGGVKDEESFFERYASITSAIRNTPYVRGYCYTQLTDVMQEINGLMTFDRKVKVDLERIKKINE